MPIKIFKSYTPAGLPILPQLRRQMPYRIADYSGAPSFVSAAASVIAQFRLLKLLWKAQRFLRLIFFLERI